MYPIYGQKGQKQIAQGIVLGLGCISYRPEGAKAQSSFCFCPYSYDSAKFFFKLFWYGVLSRTTA